ncbi:response regulator transcription factor [Dehalogenimonas formicexedens]|nr:response regulator [Dehalogenimonas formicexedens]
MQEIKPKTRVLVVDDETAILRFVSAGLELAGYLPVSTTDCDEALNIVRSGNADIMLLDIFMAPVTGFDVLTKLREFSDLPVIVFTARDDVGEFAKEAGADDYLGKPFKPGDLSGKIEEVMARRGAKAG